MSQNPLTKIKIALVYDRVNTQFGGAEQVLVALHELFPKAPLFTSVSDLKKARWAEVFPEVIPSFLQKIPRSKQHHRLLAAFMPLAFESLDLSEYELIISITSAEAKGIITTADQLHVCYLLTPTRYLYSHREEYLQSIPTLTRPPAKAALNYLTWWDQAAAARPDHYLTISKLVADRTQTYYQRSSQIIYPPVQPPTAIQKDFKPPNNWQSFWKKPFLLVMSRLVAYKRIDVAISAAIETRRQLVIAGDGPAAGSLKQQAPGHPNIHFLETVSDQARAQLYTRAQALLMPGLEDFGITGLESLSYGTPVIVNHQSGVAELINDQTHGLHLTKPTTDHLVQKIKQLDETPWSKPKLPQQAARYKTDQFQQQFKEKIQNLWQKHKEALQ